MAVAVLSFYCTVMAKRTRQHRFSLMKTRVGKITFIYRLDLFISDWIFKISQHLFYSFLLFIYSTEVASAKQLVALEEELHDAEEQLAVTSLEHKELLQVLENTKRIQRQPQRTVDI